MQDAAKRALHFLCGLEAFLRLLLHRAQNELFELRRYILAESSRRKRRIGYLHARNHGRILIVEGALRGQHLVHDASERIDVAPRIHLTSHRLLGADVMHRTDGAVIQMKMIGVGQSCNTEIRHLHVSARENHDVLRLDITVDDALMMRHRQARQHLHGAGNTFGYRQTLLRAKIIA